MEFNRMHEKFVATSTVLLRAAATMTVTRAGEEG